jgi:carbon monoxide dehydrogenase subunit G
MIYQKVTEYIDIQAPRQEVFSLITHLERRLQLSPLWGVASVEAKNGNYPQVGSSYRGQAAAL